MASSGSRVTENAEELSEKTLKQGERILAPTRRPDGTLRKPIRIRAGYVPQDEVSIYQPKGAIWKKELSVVQDVPPGYDPDSVVESKSKSKSAKRNEKKKEKRQQAASEKTKNLEQDSGSDGLLTMMDRLSLSGASLSTVPPVDSSSCLIPENQAQAIDKKIRALKKKIRLAEEGGKNNMDMKPEQVEKMAKVEGWREELKLLEESKAEMAK